MPSLFALSCVSWIVSAAADYTGALEVLVVEGDGLRHVETQHWLKTDDRRRMRLHLSAARGDELLTGDRVCASGTAWGDQLYVRDLTHLAFARAAAEPSVRTLDVVSVGFVDAPESDAPDDYEALREHFFGDPLTSVAGYFEEVSYGKVRFTGDVHIVNLPIPRPAWGDFGAVAAAVCGAQPEACDAMHVALIGDFMSGAVGSIGGGATWMSNPEYAVHALGHNLGFRHARSYACWPESYYPHGHGSCSWQEYGDDYSAMGTGAGHVSMMHKAQAGWLGPGNQASGGPGVYVLAPMELPSTELQSLNIANYWLEYRRPLGRDAHLGEGVQVRTDDGLLDVRPMSSAYGGGSTLMVAGGTFRDVVNLETDLHIRALELLREGAILQVWFGSREPLEITDVRVLEVGPTYATIGWQTAAPSDALVEYGESLMLGRASAFEPRLATRHEVRLSELTPGTIYHFRVRSTPEAGTPGYRYARLATPTAPTLGVVRDGAAGAARRTGGAGDDRSGAGERDAGRVVVASCRAVDGGWTGVLLLAIAQLLGATRGAFRRQTPMKRQSRGLSR